MTRSWLLTRKGWKKLARSTETQVTLTNFTFTTPYAWQWDWEWLLLFDSDLKFVPHHYLNTWSGLLGELPQELKTRCTAWWEYSAWAYQLPRDYKLTWVWHFEWGLPRSGSEIGELLMAQFWGSEPVKESNGFPIHYGPVTFVQAKSIPLSWSSVWGQSSEAVLPPSGTTIVYQLHVRPDSQWVRTTEPSWAFGVGPQAALAISDIMIVYINSAPMEFWAPLTVPQRLR